jgi:hypothetical protein
MLVSYYLEGTWLIAATALQFFPKRVQGNSAQQSFHAQAARSDFSITSPVKNSIDLGSSPGCMIAGAL